MIYLWIYLGVVLICFILGLYLVTEKFTCKLFWEAGITITIGAFLWPLVVLILLYISVTEFIVTRKYFKK